MKKILSFLGLALLASCSVQNTAYSSINQKKSCIYTDCSINTIHDHYTLNW